MKNLKMALLMHAAAGIAGTGIAQTADPTLAKPENTTLNTSTTAKVVGDGLDSGAKVTQMQQSGDQVKQASDDAASDGSEIKSVAPGADVAVAKQPNAGVDA